MSTTMKAISYALRPTGELSIHQRPQLPLLELLPLLFLLVQLIHLLKTQERFSSIYFFSPATYGLKPSNALSRSSIVSILDVGLGLDACFVEEAYVYAASGDRGLADVGFGDWDDIVGACATL